MQKRISLLVVLMLLFSLIPAIQTSAYTKNDMVISGGTVSDDFEWCNYPNSIPFLSVKEDSGINLMQGKSFALELNNAEWDIKHFNNFETEWKKSPQHSNVNFNGDTLEVRGETGGPAVFGGTRLLTDFDYDIVFHSKRFATVNVISNTSDSSKRAIVIPILAKMTEKGPATITIDNVDAGITRGTYTFATGSDGNVSYEIEKSNLTFSKDLVVPQITITETVPGALNITNGSKSRIELRAPNGFEFTVGAEPVTIRSFLGFEREVYTNSTLTSNTSPIHYASGKDKGTIVIELGELSGLTKTTTLRGALMLSNLIIARTDSVSNTPKGDINIRIATTGASSTNLVIGQFVNKSIDISVEDKTLPEIVSGAYPKSFDDESIQALDITIKESSIGAWNLSRRTDAIFTLSKDVKFRGVEIRKVDGHPDLSVNDSVYFISDDGKGGGSQTEESALKLTEDKLIITASGAQRKGSGDGNKIEVKLRVWVSVKPGFKGDIEFSTHEDNEAFGGNISTIIAKAIDPFTVKTVNTDINIGYMNIELGEITLKENQPGAFKKTGKSTFNGDTPDLMLWLGGSNSVYFKGNKNDVKYTVLSGDIQIDDITIDNGVIGVVVKRESSEASEIKLTGMKVDTNRSVPEGKIELRIGGSVIANYHGNNNSIGTKYGAFNTEYFIADPSYVRIVTPAPDRKYTTEVAVPIGDNYILVDGNKIPIDAASFIHDGYTMVPVRAVAEALGISPNQISWDGQNKTVTIITKDIVSQFQVGSNYVKVGNMDIYFDGPSCMVINNRTFLPFRALGQYILGCPVEWDGYNKTAYYNKSL